MVAAVSPEEIRPEAAASEPTHWLYGRYFLPLPDVSDETRQAINKGRAMPTWVEIITRLRRMERQAADRKADPDEQARAQARQRAAVTGRIEGLGVNGLAAAIGCSHTTVLRHLRHLEALGLIRTEQGEFTTELDEATGRIKRNYAKAPPKVIIVTIEDRHCRPSRAPRAARGDTPGTGPKASGDTPETVRKAPESQDRNWRVPRERNSKEFRSSGTKERRTAAGPGTGPAAAAAEERGHQAGPPDPAGEWQRQAEQDAQRRARERQIETFANGLQIPAIEVIALMRANPDELKRIATEAGILTTDGKFARFQPRPWRFGESSPPAVSAETQQAIRAGIEEISDPARLTPEQSELLANVTKATKTFARRSLIESDAEAGKAVA